MIESQPIKWKPGLAWVAIVSLIEVMAVLAGAGAPLQPLLSVLFVLTCPGFLILDMTSLGDLPARVMLGITASIAANVAFVTIALVGDAQSVAPVIVLALVGLAALPRDRLRAAVAKVQAGLHGLVAAPAPLPATPPSDGATVTKAPVPQQDEATRNQQNPKPTPTAATEAPAEGEDPPAVVVFDVDINRAGATEYARLPGIGSSLAQRIVAHRDKNGPFTDAHGLLQLLRSFAIEEDATKK